MVTKTEALKRGFGEAELAGLQFFSKTSARNFKMKLYLESQLADLVAARGSGAGGEGGEGGEGGGGSGGGGGGGHGGGDSGRASVKGATGEVGRRG